VSKRKSTPPATGSPRTLPPAHAADDRATLELQLAVRQSAAAYHRGDWPQARELCRGILTVRPAHFDALNILGIVAARTGQLSEAVEFLSRAVDARPKEAAAHNNFGIALKNVGRGAEALASYERALRIEPNFAEAHFNCGVALELLGRPEEALTSYGHALRVRPDYADAYNNRGKTLQGLKRVQQALDDYDRALSIQPRLAEAHNNRGVALHELKRFEEALQSYELALGIQPAYAVALNNRGNAHRTLGQWEPALGSYARALEIEPDFADALNSRGAVLQELGQFDEALESCDRALAVNPDLAVAHNTRSIALRSLKRFEDALASSETALRIKPGYVEALNNRGSALEDLGRLAEALESIEQALKIQPDNATLLRNRSLLLKRLERFDEALATMQRAHHIDPHLEWFHGVLLHMKMHLCEWSDLNSHVAKLIADIGQNRPATPPHGVFGLVDRLSIQRQAAQTWANRMYRAREPTLPPRLVRKNAGHRIRVGYFSADFHQHATTSLIAEMLERHDRSSFEIVGFSFGPDVRDAMRERVSAGFDRFFDVRANPGRDIARLSRDLGVDIAVDLKGYTEHERTDIFSHRAAPIQVNYLGYPGTLGAEFMDYIIADPVVIPAESRAGYQEKIAYLPHSYQVNDRKRRIEEAPPSREELGLPATGFVFCGFHSVYKIAPGTFDGWMRILKQVDGSVLWLLGNRETSVRNLRREAAARGVSADRLLFAPTPRPHAEHLARQRAGDLFLDTAPCNAHTTASDALWVGLPVLTLAGESFAARVAASLLCAIGMPDLIAETQEEYEALAVDIATNPVLLRQLRDKLEANRLTTPLFDTEKFTRHLEDAYRQMYRRLQMNLNPDHLWVAD
jgi:protein O-GlcNAc transferase